MLVLSRRSAPTAFLRTKRPGVRGSPPPGISTPGNPHFRGVCETRRNRHPHVGPPTRANLGPGPPLEIIATFISPPGTLPPPRARIGGVGRQGGKGGNRLAERHGSRRGNGQPPPLSAWRSRGTGPGQGPRSWAGGARTESRLASRPGSSICFLLVHRRLHGHRRHGCEY